MTETITKKTKRARREGETEDLSEQIARSVQKRPGEQVRCVRVFGDCYRCNWWASDGGESAVFANMATIRKSRFLRVTKIADGLVMDDLSAGA